MVVGSCAGTDFTGARHGKEAAHCFRRPLNLILAACEATILAPKTENLLR
jgi:hypothetical protein